MKRRLKSRAGIVSIGMGLIFFMQSAFAQSVDNEDEAMPLDDEFVEEPAADAPLRYRAETTSVSASGSAKVDMRQNKISLDLKGLDIVDVLKMISSRSGFNIVVGKNVTGKVTIFLKDVDMWDALEIILASNNLAYEKKDAIIYVMTDRDYEFIYGEKFGDKKQLLSRALQYAKAQDTSAMLNQVKSNIGRVVVDEATNTVVVLDTPGKVRQMDSLLDELDKPTQSKVFELRYAQADKISPKIQEAISKGVGSISVDERTNKIAVTDYPHKLLELGKIIEAFDEKTPQVRIDAQIIEISPDKDEFKLGIDWDLWINKTFRFINSLPMGNANKLSLGLAAGGSSVSEKYDREGVIDALRTIGKTQILSSPSIMALNNQEAKILVGTKEAYITSTTSQGGTGTEVTSQQVNFVDVGIKLYVTPTINKDGFVTMKIKPEVSSSKTTDLTAEGKVTQVPIVTTSEAETTISVKDGATIVIAGLKKDKKEDEIKKFLLLGDIPILGIPFRSVSHAVNKTELVIFLTPHIIDENNPPTYTDLYGKEYSQKTSGKSLIQGKSQGYDKTDSLRVQEVIVKPSGASRNQDIQLIATARDYGEHIRNRIMSAVSILSANAQLKGEALVSFILEEDGKLLYDPQIVFSTSEALREPTVNAVKSAAPFAQFPQDLRKSEERFSLSITYN